MAESIPLRVKKLDEKAVLPERAYSGDAGFDLVAVSAVENIDGTYECGSGLAFCIPDGFVGLLFPRSSIKGRNISLTNGVGVIDSGYRGEVKAVFRKAGTEKGYWEPYTVGEKFAQLVILPLPEIECLEVEELEESERGEGGYGSSGTPPWMPSAALMTPSITSRFCLIAETSAPNCPRGLGVKCTEIRSAMQTRQEVNRVKIGQKWETDKESAITWEVIHKIHDSSKFVLFASDKKQLRIVDEREWKIDFQPLELIQPTKTD